MFSGLPSWQVGFSMNLLMALSTESPLAVLGSCGCVSLDEEAVWKK